MSRNYGINRDMSKAGEYSLREMSQRGEVSFSTAATISSRWSQACEYFRENGIKKMESVSRNEIIRYGETLAEKVEAGNMSPATAQNYISAVNVVLEIASGNKEKWVSPTKDCEISERNGICKESKSISGEQHRDAIEKLSPLAATLLDLQRELGLRHKESMLLNAKLAVAQYRKYGTIRIKEGTKGGRPRELEITKQSQIAALINAAELQGKDRSMIPSNQTYIEASRAIYREVGEIGVKQHGERHAFAQLRYFEKLGLQCPVVAGIKHGNAHFAFIAKEKGISISEAKQKDHEARLQIAEELGHSRIEITNSYLG